MKTPNPPRITRLKGGGNMNFLNKVLNKFKNKKFVSWFAVCIAAIIMVSTVLGIMVPSYTNWKEYYDAAIAERDYNKYLSKLPADCLGITVTLNENVVYYDNGKASPKNSDFTVVARMSEKGVESDKILFPNEYTVLPEKGFAKNGGNLTVSYTFTPEAKEGEDPPQPKVLTQTLPYALEKVVPVSLERSSLPYRIVYSDKMPFDGEGMSAKVTFNDGSAETVGNDEFVYSEAALAAGTDTVSVTWSRGGTEFDFDCPVTVVPEANYDDGYITAIAPAGTICLEPGADTSAAKPPVRATYESGNRLLLDEDMYTVRGNTAKASFTSKCILNVFLATDASIFTRTAAIVKSGIRAENATLTQAEKVNVFETEQIDGEYVTSETETTVVAPRNGTSIKFNVAFDAISKPEFAIRAALKPEADEVNLADILIMRVNDTTVKIPATSLSRKAGEEDKYVFYDLTLPAAVVQSGGNEVRLIFRGEGANKILIDEISLETGFSGKFFSSTEAYFADNSATGTAGEYEFTTIKPFGAIAGKTWGHSICSDGTYLYMLGHGDGTPRAAAVSKYDPRTNTEVAVSATLDASKYTVTEDYAGITYYDNKIIIYCPDGTMLYAESGEKFTAGCEFKEYDGEGGNLSKIKDVYYNAAKSRFAVFYEISSQYAGLNVYDRSMNVIKSIQIPASLGNGAKAKRMTGSADYIYVNHTTNEKYWPIIKMFDWDGNQIGGREMNIDVDESFLKNNLGVKETFRTNIQALAVINGDFYVTVLKFGAANGSGSAILKVAMKEPDPELLPDLDFSEYFKLCMQNGISPTLSIEPATQKYTTDGALDKSAVGYAMGGASDGKYLYLALNKSKADAEGNALNNATVIIKKVNAETYETVATTAVTDVAESVMRSDNSRLFIKDGKLYLVAGDVYSISLDEVVDNCTIPKDEGMTALLTDGGNRVLKSAYWDETQRRYVLLDNGDNSKNDNPGGDVYIVDEDGNFIEMFSPAKPNGWKTADITGDGKYIYVLYNSTKGAFRADVYGFDGIKVTTLSISGVRLSGDVNFNIQALFFHNGAMHAGVCSWQEGHLVYHDWVVRCDVSVL